MRLCDSITAFPSILLALVVIAVLGPGKWNVIWVLGILFIPSFARIVRGEFARCKHLNYIKSARLMGAGPVRIMVRHILPNTLPVLLPAISIGFNNAVLAEASMSFLGVGVSATEPSPGPYAFRRTGLSSARPALVCAVCRDDYCAADPGFQSAERGLAAAPPCRWKLGEETAMLEVKDLRVRFWIPPEKYAVDGVSFLWTTGKFWDLWAKAVLERV